MLSREINLLNNYNINNYYFIFNKYLIKILLIIKLWYKYIYNNINYKNVF